MILHSENVEELIRSGRFFLATLKNPKPEDEVAQHERYVTLLLPISNDDVHPIGYLGAQHLVGETETLRDWVQLTRTVFFSSFFPRYEGYDVESVYMGGDEVAWLNERLLTRYADLLQGILEDWRFVADQLTQYPHGRDQLQTFQKRVNVAQTKWVAYQSDDVKQHAGEYLNDRVRRMFPKHTRMYTYLHPDKPGTTVAFLYRENVTPQFSFEHSDVLTASWEPDQPLITLKSWVQVMHDFFGDVSYLSAEGSSVDEAQAALYSKLSLINLGVQSIRSDQFLNCFIEHTSHAWRYAIDEFVRSGYLPVVPQQLKLARTFTGH